MNADQIHAELDEQARIAEQTPMPEGLTDAEQVRWLEDQIRRQRERMGLEQPMGVHDADDDWGF